MRILSLFIACSLDGFIARKNGAIDWLFTDDDYGYTSFMKDVDTVLMGRATYDLALSFGEFPYAKKQCFVFSRTLQKVDIPNVTVVREAPDSFVRYLKGLSGRKIWLVGGAQIVTVLREIIDEYVVSIHPILLGGGIPLFPNSSPDLRLRLVNSTAFPSGLVQVHYRRV